MPKQKSYTSRDGAWPIESDRFLEPIRIQNLQQFDINAPLAHTTFDLAISLTVNPYCFISVTVSLNSRRRDVQDKFKFTFSFNTCKTLKLLLLQGR